MKLTSSKKWIDTHFHVFNAHEAVQGARYVPDYEATLNDWMAQAQSVGVGRGVCVQPSFLGTDNTLMLQTLAQHPESLRGVAVVSTQTSPEALRVMHDGGVRGVRLNLAGVSHDISEWTRASSLWEAFNALGWHIEVHTDQGALPELLTQLPTDIPVVVDHMAKPFQATSDDRTVKALVQRASHSPTYIKLSGAYRLAGVDGVSLVKLWAHELGTQALMWGSDWPCTNHESFAHYDVLFSALQNWVTAEQMDDVLINNPQRLYWGSE